MRMLIMTISSCIWLAFFVPSVAAQSGDRAHLLQQFNLQKTYRSFERDTRHFHYVVTTALLSSYGGWRNLPENYNATQAGLIDGVVEKMSPATNRLKARAANLKGITEEEAAKLIAATEKFQRLFETSIEIRDLLLIEDVDAANNLYYERALPVFEEIWRTNFTLLSEAERRIPSK